MSRLVVFSFLSLLSTSTLAQPWLWGPPTPQSIVGKRLVGPITITGQNGVVIEDVHVTSETGPCIKIHESQNITIRNSEIGPCGTLARTVEERGVTVTNSSGITVIGNVIHDVSTGLYATNSFHPITFEKNFVFNIRGPYWQGSAAQLSNVRTGKSRSRISCNVIDDRYGVNSHATDHISLFNTRGLSTSEPVEISSNRIRGATSGNDESGTGINVGDVLAFPEYGIHQFPLSEYVFVHHNTVTLTNGVGIQVGSGQNTIVEDNLVDNRGPDLASMTGFAFAIRNYNPDFPCAANAINRNRGIARLWSYNHDGSPGEYLFDPGQCSYSASGNDFADSTLSPDMFFDLKPECQNSHASTFVRCADSYETCTLPGTEEHEVTYGRSASESYALKFVRGGSVGCHEGVFTDPAVGFQKSCFARPSTSFESCSAQNQLCRFPRSGTWEVAYTSRSSGKAFGRLVSGERVACADGVFGDPEPGAAKACSIRPVDVSNNSLTYVRCAGENGVCHFPRSGRFEVLYGVDERTGYAFTEVNGAEVECSNAVFGDPSPGVVKQCFYRSSPRFASCANEGGVCVLPSNGTFEVFYGVDHEQGLVKPFEGPARVACRNTVFGDPAPGKPKRCLVRQVR